MPKISLYCPPMKVSLISGKLRRTDAEPMVAAIFDDLGGQMVAIDNVVIPETYVRRVGWNPLNWMVDACVGKDEDGLIAVGLPVEPVRVYPLRGYSIAQQIEAPVSLWFQGKNYWGSVIFPDCKASLWTGIAEAVTARGTIELAE